MKQSRSYVDKPTASADTSEELRELSREMEEIAACRGFVSRRP
jgi:hypothetical protein